MPCRSVGPWRRGPGGLRIEVTAGCLAARRKLVREPVEQGNQAGMLTGMPVTDILRDALMPGLEQSVERVLAGLAERHRLVRVWPQHLDVTDRDQFGEPPLQFGVGQLQ